MKKLIIILILSISTISIYGENTDKDINQKINLIESKIVQLENENEKLVNYKLMYEDQFKLLEKKEENSIKALGVRFEELESKSFGVLIPALIIAMFGTLYSINKLNKIKETISNKIESSVNDKVEEELKKQEDSINKTIQNFVDEKTREISNRILDEYKERILNETILKLSKRILVLSLNESSTFLNKFFSYDKFGFKQPEFNLVKNYEYKGGYDIIIFDAENSIDNNDLNSFYEFFENYKSDLGKNLILFYFNTKGVRIDNNKFDRTISFSNSNATLYEKIIEAMKYQDFIEKNI